MSMYPHGISSVFNGQMKEVVLKWAFEAVVKQEISHTSMNSVFFVQFGPTARRNKSVSSKRAKVSTDIANLTAQEAFLFDFSGLDH